jgi:hypothetical protein
MLKHYGSLQNKIKSVKKFQNLSSGRQQIAWYEKSGAILAKAKDKLLAPDYLLKQNSLKMNRLTRKSCQYPQ